jgi:hypothetical protein
MYKIINEILDSYMLSGVNPLDLIEYMNTVKENYDFILAKIEQKCTLNNIEFTKEDLEYSFKDNIRDRIAFINDITKTT